MVSGAKTSTGELSQASERLAEPVPLTSWQTWLLALLLVVSVCTAYHRVWNAGFIWDDDIYVVRNQLLTAPDGLQRIWFSTDSPSQYFPLVYTTFRFERSLWGLNPTGYHVVNVLIHAANALLLWGLLRRLKIPGAWLAAAIFALHPVQVESVAWITERKNVLTLFFSLLAMLAWDEFTEARRNGLWRYYALALLCYALALFSKTTACTLPVTMLLLLWLKRQPLEWKRWVQVSPFVLLGIGMGLLTVWWESHHQGIADKFTGIGPIERVLIASHAVWFYYHTGGWQRGSCQLL
ncbi:MAG: glycosyltransferase family 39 protein [Verrucomicrobia bacterium]|nr:glycosyltransferase family 39 protein [Verrucomicrobiota bacterium]